MGPDPSVNPGLLWFPHRVGPLSELQPGLALGVPSFAHLQHPAYLQPLPLRINPAEIGLDEAQTGP